MLILVVTLPSSPILGLTERTQYVLADIYTSKADINGPLGMKMYDSISTAQVVDMTCVQCLVGRVKALAMSHSARAKPIWAIIDRMSRNPYRT